MGNLWSDSRAGDFWDASQARDIWMLAELKNIGQQAKQMTKLEPRTRKKPAEVEIWRSC